MDPNLGNAIDFGRDDDLCPGFAFLRKGGPHIIINIRLIEQGTSFTRRNMDALGQPLSLTATVRSV